MVVFTVSLDCLWEMKSCAKGQVNPKLKFTVMSPCCIHNPAYCLLHHYKVLSRTAQPTAVLWIPLHAIGCPSSAPEAKYHPLSLKIVLRVIIRVCVVVRLWDTVCPGIC